MEETLSNAHKTFIEGLIGGFGLIIASKSAIPLDEGGFILYVLNEMLRIFENATPTADYSSVKVYLILVGLVLSVISIIAFKNTITQNKDWRIGILAYVFGLIFSFVIFAPIL